MISVILVSSATSVTSVTLDTSFNLMWLSRLSLGGSCESGDSMFSFSQVADSGAQAFEVGALLAPTVGEAPIDGAGAAAMQGGAEQALSCK